MHTGYIHVAPGRRLFYWYAESERSPDTDPLVVWFTGGPGCSGLNALLNENGPVAPKTDGSEGLMRNPYSWNRIANVLWLEQPAGVGFSITEGESMYMSSDTQAAQDNFVFLKKFVNEEFPSLKGRNVWLTGESYAGMYVPTLAQNILKGDDSVLAMSLKGLMMGNPVLFCQSAGLMSTPSIKYQFNRYFYSGLLSFSAYAEWNKWHCDEMDHRKFMYGLDDMMKCIEIYNEATKSIGVIYQQLEKKKEKLTQTEFNEKEEKESFAKSVWMRSKLQANLDPDNLYQDFCTGNGTLDTTLQKDPETCRPLGGECNKYLNKKEVQEALGIDSKEKVPWSVCNQVNLSYQRDLEKEGLVPVLREIFSTLSSASSLSVLYYSGDVDIATVATQITQACLHELTQAPPAVSMTKAWRPWTIGGWHAGYVENFDRYTFATIKGAGHEAPTFQPHISFEMFQRFLEKQSLEEAPPQQEDDPLSERFKVLPQVKRPVRPSDVLSSIRQEELLKAFAVAARKGEGVDRDAEDVQAVQEDDKAGGKSDSNWRNSEASPPFAPSNAASSTPDTRKALDVQREPLTADAEELPIPLPSPLLLEV